MENTIKIEDAQNEAISVAGKMGVEEVSLDLSLSRILSEDLYARTDVPPHRNSAMDGFAVRASDVQSASEARPIKLAVVGDIAAGHSATRALESGEAMRIMTGAPLPDGADTIIMVERTHIEGGDVVITHAPPAGEHVRHPGEDVRKADRILRAGARVTAAAIGLLASQQIARVKVRKRPRVSILATGDELRDLDQPLDGSAIAESNRLTLAALVSEAGGEPRCLPIVRDDPALIRRAIEEGASGADIVLSSGGVSVGDYDHVKQVLTDMGAQLRFWRVAMKPGKPIALFTLPSGLPYFGLPGNPVSSMVSFYLFVRPAIRAALGAEPFDLQRAHVILDGPVRSGDRRHYARAKLHHAPDGLHALPMPKQGSHVLTSMLDAGALLVVEPGTSYAAGDRIPALLLP